MTARAELRDDDGRVVATYLRGDRDGRPLADLLEAEPGSALDEVARTAVDRLPGWRVSAARPLGRSLLAAGATPARYGTIMRRQLTTAPPAAPAPAGIAVGPIDRPAADLVDALMAAFGPGHPDHAEGSGRAKEAAHISGLLAGRIVGPLLPAARLATDSAGRVAGAAITCEHPPDDRDPGGPWLANLFRHPEIGPPGTGAALLRAVIDELRTGGREALGLVVTEGNPARRLYDRFGFEVVTESLDVLIPER